jgi:hypothetical protein
LRDHEGEFGAVGARLAAVGLGDMSYATAFRQETGITFPLLVDERREAYRAAGLRSASPLDIARPANLAAGLRATLGGHRQHRTGAHPMQLGGSFVFGPGDVQIFAHVNQTFSDDATPAALLAALRTS